jgi:hypothetical protein
MALVRRGKQTYLVKSMRIGGKVTSRCLASGEQARVEHELSRRFAAKERRLDRAERARERRFQADMKAYDRETARMEAEILGRAEAERAAIEESVKGLVEGAKRSVAALMTRAGYHQHRWTWRRNKKGRPMTSEVPEIPDSIKPGLVAQVQAEIQSVIEQRKGVEFIDLMEKSDRDNPGETLVASTRRAFRICPANNVLEKLIGRVGAGDISRELLKRQFAEVRADLEGSDPSPIERHLAEVTAIAWLDFFTAKAVALNSERGELFSIQEKEHYDRAADRAHRRYLSCLRSLTLVRNKALPALRLQVAVQGANGATAAASVELAEPGRQNPG